MICGNDLEKVKIKLKGLKQVLKLWREQVFNKQKVRKPKNVEEIKELDQKDAIGVLQEEMRIKKAGLLGELKNLAERENVMLKQKARVEWMVKGDTNSKFFHASLRWRLLNNEIKGLPINGVWCEEPQLVKEEVLKYFRQVHTTNQLEH